MWQSFRKIKLSQRPEKHRFHHQLEQSPESYLSNLDHNSDYWVHLFEVEYGLEDEFFKATHQKSFSSLVLGNTRKERLQAIQNRQIMHRDRSLSIKTQKTPISQNRPLKSEISHGEGLQEIDMPTAPIQNADLENPMTPEEQAKWLENP